MENQLVDLKADQIVNSLTPEPIKTSNSVAIADPILSFFTEKEQEKILKYMDDGLPNIIKLNDVNLARMQDMFMEGFSYAEISNRIRVKIEGVLYCAYKYKWPEIKNKKLDEIGGQLEEKYRTAKLESASFISEMIQAWHEYYRGIIETYRSTKDRSVMDSMDLKHIDKYFKAVELLDKMMSKQQSSEKPVISLPEGGTVTSSGNTLTITPEVKETSEILRLLAELNKSNNK